MKILLDTHAWLWWITNNKKLSQRAHEIIASGSNELFLSVASLWEVLSKVQIGKLPFPIPAGPYVREQLTRNGVRLLSISLDHVLRLEHLPLHHRDPFDRILVAQSLEEELPILTADPLFKDYSATLIW
jgi:PIN domain nuclease of toxin-antitoxin system